MASSSGRSTAAIPRCNAASTYVWFALSPNGAAGTIYYPVEFTNLGSRTCTLRGYPRVAALSKSFHQIGPAARRIGAVVRTITLRPHQTAHAMLGIVEKGIIGGCHNATGVGLRVTPPHQIVRQTVGDFTFPACTNKVFMSVYPVARGIGVP